MPNQLLTDTNNDLDEKYLYLLNKVDFTPIFIMGEHRSGTTLLYKTLVETECFNFVKAYHIIKYKKILSNHVNDIENQAYQELDDQLKSLGINDRVIDKLKVTPDFPEEYGFILRNLVGDDSKLTDENLSIFKELCQKVQLTSKQNRPLLLKNPWDFSQFLYIKKSLPNAKIIFIHRHPIHVINSKLKAVRSFFSNWNSYLALISQRYKKIFKNPIKLFFYRMLYSSYFDLGLHRTIKDYLTSTSYFLENIGKLPQTDYISIKYEDLCDRPEETILKVLEFLELEARKNLDYQNLIETRPTNLLPEVEKNYDLICQKLKPYLKYHNYKP